MAQYDSANSDEQPIEGAPPASSQSEDDKILERSRKGLQECVENEQIEREKMLDDLRFATLDQWPADIRNARENDVVNGARPCLTVDQCNQYITQVSNDMRANRPAIKIRPVDDKADPDTAKIVQGLVRHIEDQSSAHIAYETGGEMAVTIGLGFIRVATDYVAPDSFDQEIVIKRVPDTFSTYLSSHNMPDGSDAECAWVFEKLPIDTFKRMYPGKTVADADFAGLGIQPTWKTAEEVIVCEFFYKHHETVELLYLADGQTMFRPDYDALPDDAQKPPITGKRNSDKVTVRWCKHTGAEVIDKRELKGKYIPVVEIVGKEKIVDGKRLLWGLVRPAKDSLRAFNYWISAMTEKMALAPKAPWVGAVGQFASQGEKWDKANVNNYSKLEYDPIDVNGNQIPAPRRQEPIQMEAAMAQMLGIMQNNVKSSLGMYKASIGDSESQQSGRAILALKKESDTGTMHFGENQAISIAQVGRIVVDLIPHYYDTKRVLRILGEDGAPQSVQLDPEQDVPKRQVMGMDGKIRSIYNLGVGKYDVTVTVGPGYTTSRQEASTVMTELANSAKDPASAAIMRYGAVKSADFHGSDEVAKMLKVMLPAPALEAISTEAVEIPPKVQAKMQEMGQQMQMMNEQGQKLMQENQQLKSGAQTDMAKVQADHDAKMKALELDKQVEAERARLAEEKAKADFALKKWVAEQERGLAREDFDFKQECDRNKMADDAKEKFLKEQVSQVDMLPTVLETLAAPLTQMAQGIQQMVALQQQTLEAFNRPRRVALSGITTDAEGRVTGANVNPTLQ